MRRIALRSKFLQPPSPPVSCHSFHCGFVCSYQQSFCPKIWSLAVSCRSSCRSPLCGPSGVATVMLVGCAQNFVGKRSLPTRSHFSPVLSAQPLDLLPSFHPLFSLQSLFSSVVITSDSVHIWSQLGLVRCQQERLKVVCFRYVKSTFTHCLV